MKLTTIALGIILSAPAYAQLTNPSSGTTVDQPARDAAAQALSAANASVKMVNGNAPDVNGLVTVPIPPAPDLSPYATNASLSAVQAVANSAVQSVNGIAPSAGNVALTIPTAYTDAQAVAANATPIANAVAPTLKYITGFTMSSPGLKASLPTCGGASAPIGSYAIVSDLYSGSFSTNEAMRCGQTGTITYWRPVRTDLSVSMATPTAATSLLPLITPPIIHYTTTATASATVTPSTVGAYPGEQFTIVQDGTLGLFSLQVGGLLGGLLNMVTGGTRVLTYSCTSATTPVCAWTGN